MAKKTERYGYMTQAQPPAVQEADAAPKKPVAKKRTVKPARVDVAPAEQVPPTPTQTLLPRAATGAAAALRDPEQFKLPPAQRGRPATEGLQRRGDVEREQMNVRIRGELKRAAAALGAMQGMSLGDVIEQALVDYIKKQQQGE